MQGEPVADEQAPRAHDASPLKGEPTNPDETVPKEHQPDPPEGGNRQPREPDAVENEPGSDL